MKSKLGRWCGPILLAFGLSLGLTISFSSPLADALGLSITTSPVSVILSATPGSTVTTQLHVQNNEPVAVPMTIKLFTFTAAGTTGKPALLVPTAADTFLNWAQFSPSSFVAEPNTPETITMTINVPTTASLGYNYGVAIEPVSTAALNGSGTTVNGSNLILVLLNTNSANEVHSIQIASFTASKKLYDYLPVSFSINIHNNGNVFLAPTGNVFISKNSSFAPGSIIDSIPVNTGGGNVLPGTNRIFQVQWNDGFPLNVPKEIDGHQVTKNNQLVYQLKWNFSQTSKFRIGQYYAKLVMAYSNGARQVPITGMVSFWVIPWKLLFLLLLFIVAFIGLIVAVFYLKHRLKKLQKMVEKK
jgi:hypothetical protein